MVDPVAALTAVLPEEQGAASASVNAAKLSGLPTPPPEDTRPRTIALVGSAAALLLLGLIVAIAQTTKRHQQRGP